MVCCPSGQGIALQKRKSGVRVPHIPHTVGSVYGCTDGLENRSGVKAHGSIPIPTAIIVLFQLQLLSLAQTYHNGFSRIVIQESNQ